MQTLAPQQAHPSAPPAMLGRVVLLVHDYDEALDFYRAALGATALFDRTTEGQRFLHVGLPGQPDASGDGGPPAVGLWFLRATGEEERARVGRQTGGHPFLVLYTPDCARSLERFTRAGGELRRPMREADGARFAHVADLYGNEIVLVQMLP